MEYTKNKFIACVFLLFSLSSCAQIETHKKMKETTIKLVNYLQRCDTLGILQLLDSSFAHTNKSNFRTFITASILSDCSFFNTVTRKNGIPDFKSIIFKKDSTQIIDANIVILPLINTVDSTLNIKKCFLVLIFQPDKYFSFNSHLLRYLIAKEEIKVNKIKDKIEMPSWLKEINNKKYPIQQH